MIRSPYDRERMVFLLAPVDQAFVASEAKWGVARLERLVSSATLISYRRGWIAYRTAIEDGDVNALETIAPKMIAALAFMDREATKAGHSTLSVETWETPLADGAILTIVKTMPEAHELARTIAGRHTVVYTLEEIGRIITHYEMTNAIKLAFPGAEVKSAVIPGDKVVSGVQMNSSEVADWATADPLAEFLYQGTPV